MSLLRYSLVYLVARGTQGAANLVAIALYTRLLPSAEYGRYALVLSGVSFASILLFHWVQMSLLRLYPAYQRESALLLRTVATSVTALMTLPFLAAVVLILLLRGVDSSQGLIFSAALLTAAAGWYDMTLTLQQAQLRPMHYALMSILRVLIALCTGVLVALLFTRTAAAPITGLLTGTLLTSFWFGGMRWFRKAGLLDRSVLCELWGYGAPLTMAFALSFVVSSSDRFMIAGFLGEAAAGVYAASYDLAQQTITMLMSTVSAGSCPLVITTFEKHGIEAARAQMKQYFVLLLAIASPVVAGAVLLAPNIGHVILGREFQAEAAAIIPGVSAAALLAGFRAYYLDFVFQLKRTTVLQIKVMGFAALLNILLNLWWIPRLGLMGAVYSTGVAYLGAAVMSYWLGRPLFRVPFPAAEAAKIAIAVGAMSLALLPMSASRGVAALFAQVIVGIIIYGGLLWLLDVQGCRTQLGKGLRQNGARKQVE